MSRFTNNDNNSRLNIKLTPIHFIRSLGDFDCDPAYLPKFLRPWDTARIMYSKEQDGMKQQWHGRVFLNPPYISEDQYRVKDWIRKFIRHKNGIMLLSNSTEASYYHQFIFPFADAILFKEGRIDYCDINGNQIKGNQLGSIFCALGDHNVIALKRSKIRGHLLIHGGEWVRIE